MSFASQHYASALTGRPGAGGRQATRDEPEITRIKRSMAEQLTRCEQLERDRIARLLHDELQQQLVAAQMEVSLLSEAAACPAAVQSLHVLLNQAIESTHRLVSNLSPPILHGVGLLDAMRWLGEKASMHGLRVEVDGDECDADLSEELRIVLFQAVRELLLNVAKHARTRQARVAVRRQGDFLAITVADQGVGFDPQAQPHVAQPAGGFGLADLRHRLACMGGDIAIESVPGCGTQATVTLMLTAGPIG